MRATARLATFSARAWLRLALLTALLFPGTILSVRAAEPTTPQTPVPLSHPGTFVGRTSAAQTITVAAGLKPADQKSLDAFLADLYDPASPSYHQYLTPQQYTQRFFDPAARKQVVNYLHAQGFTVNDPGVGSVIDATGTVAQVEQAFSVRLSDYRDAKGRVFFANDVTPAIPLSIANLIDGIVGLDNAPHAMPASQARPTVAGRLVSGGSRDAPTRQTVCAGAQTEVNNFGGYLPDQFATAYHLKELYTQGYHGENQTVALLELSDYHDSDPATYQSCFGTNVPLTRINVDGGPTDFNNEDEVNLDIEILAGLAPKLAGILVYLSAPDNLALLHQYRKIANDNLAPIVSISWANCEVLSPFSAISVYHVPVEQMAAQGQSVFAAAGDFGSTGCLGPKFGGSHQLSTLFPSEDPYATGVGGTHLTADANTGTWTGETVWNTYPASNAGGTGGVSIYWDRPGWQRGPGANSNPFNPNNKRMVPDVTIAGDTQYIIFTGGGWYNIGGTSAGAPHWAAGVTLINQYLLAHGNTRLGFANPALYAVFGSGSYSAAFHDITVGNNCTDPASTYIVTPNTQPNQSGDLYTTTTGYDLASGIGSPNFGNLAAFLSGNLLSPTIATISPSSGPIAGGNRVTITGTNFVAGMGVYFGSNFVPATNIVVVSSTRITATAPAGASGAVDITLTTPGILAQITLPGGYTYGVVNPLPDSRPPVSTSSNPGAAPNGRPGGGPPGGPVQPNPPSRP